MTLTLNNNLADSEMPIYLRTVARIMCVNRIYPSKNKIQEVEMLQALKTRPNS